MNQATTPSSVSARETVTHEEISRHAQELWEKYGRPVGRDEEIWLEAERLLQHRGSVSAEEQTATQPEAVSEPPSPATPPPSAANRPARPSAASATAKMPGGRSGARKR
jgi:hypothetical protein